MKKYPFKFLNSYSKEDKGIFFGRDEEINTLYDLVFQSSIVIVYGTSGTGKTSLINCGLAGKFQPHDWLPLMVRRGNNLNDSLEKVLNDSGGNTSTMSEASNWFDEWSDEGEKTSAVLSPVDRSIKALFQKSFKPIYLIFDQFEELYVLGSKEEQAKFIRTIKEILTIQQPLKIILSIREEFLGYLYDFEKEVPQLLNKRLRVESMKLDKVKDVIRGINEYPLSLVRFKADEIDTFTEEIFERLKGKEKTLTIQLPYLQVFLDKLYMIKTNDDNHHTDTTFSLDDLKKIGDIDDVLQNFLEEQVTRISRELSSNKSVVTSETIWKILSNFCTLEGTKEPISKMELVIRLKGDLNEKFIDQSFDEFVKSRILKKFEDEDLYELTHDALALKIAEKRSEDDISVLEVLRLIKSKAALKAEFQEYFTEKQINFIEPYLSKITSELSAAERSLIKDSQKILQKKRRKKKLWRASIVLFIILGLIISGMLGNKRIIKLELLSDIHVIETQITSANSKNNLAKVNFNIDPTNSLQFIKEAMVIMDAVNLRIDTLKNKSYLFNNGAKKEKQDKLKLVYQKTKLLLEKRADSLVKQDYALYKIAKVKNPEQAIFDIRYINGIFPATNNDSIKVWYAEKSIRDNIEGHGQLAQVVFPEDSNEAMALYKDGTARYWGTKNYYGKLNLQKNDKITSISVIHYDVIGYKMLSALNNKKIVEWNLNGTIRVSSDRKVIYEKRNIEFKDSVVSIAISPNRTKIFTASDKGMGIIWPTDTTNVKLLDTKKIAFSLLQDTIICSVFSNNGLMIITGSTDNTAKIWNAENGKEIKTLRGHTGPITSVAFSADDSFVYTSSLDSTFRQWCLPPIDSIFNAKPLQWNKTKSFDSLFIMKIIEPLPGKNE